MGLLIIVYDKLILLKWFVDDLGSLYEFMWMVVKNFDNMIEYVNIVFLVRLN